MKNAICLALLAVLATSQVHAQVRGGSNPSNSSQTTATMTSAGKSAKTIATQVQVRALLTDVKNSEARDLSDTLKRNLVRNMALDAKILATVSAIRADTKPANKELNRLALNVLALQNTRTNAVDLVSGPDARLAQEAEAALANALVEAKGWTDTKAVAGVISFAKAYTEAKRLPTDSALMAMNAAQAKNQSVEWKRLKELCLGKA